MTGGLTNDLVQRSVADGGAAWQRIGHALTALILVVAVGAATVPAHAAGDLLKPVAPAASAVPLKLAAPATKTVPAPAPSAAPAPAPKAMPAPAAASAPLKKAKTRRMGGDEDLEELEVERARRK